MKIFFDDFYRLMYIGNENKNKNFQKKKKSTNFEVEVSHFVVKKCNRGLGRVTGSDVILFATSAPPLRLSAA